MSLNLRKGDNFIVLAENEPYTGEVGTFRKLAGMLITLVFESGRCYGYYPSEVARQIADSPIARKLYGDKIAVTKDNYIYVRLKNEND